MPGTWLSENSVHFSFAIFNIKYSINQKLIPYVSVLPTKPTLPAIHIINISEVLL